ncbi:MAG: DUF3857 domain-containing protein [Bacteroidota bacterium]
MKIRSIILKLFFLLLPIFLCAQKPPKFGKPTSKEKAITSTLLDPNAAAIILWDYGKIEFQGGNVHLYRHIRIKILDQNGMDEANIALPFYAKDKTEKISKIKAQTINYDDKGKAEKVKVNKSDIFTVNINEEWTEKRFAFPNVKVGSIIEYQYQKTSENAVSLEEWQFQNELPTLKSHLEVVIGSGLDYKIVYNGRRTSTQFGNESRNVWLLENLPPLKDEDFCPNPMNYVESIRFQLAGYTKYSSTSVGDPQYVELMSSWEKLAVDMLQTASYRGILQAQKSAKTIIQEIVNDQDTELEKVKKIYRYVQRETNWDGELRLFADRKITEIFAEKIGSSAEINLVLVRLLQVADLDANPVIISTKRHGLVTKVYPLYTQFNHVVAQVSINGKDILMDATNDFRPYNLLASYDYNSEGYLLDKKNPRWIKLDAPKKNRAIIVNEVSFTEDTVKYKISYSFFQHEAVKYRSAYYQVGGADSFIKENLLNADDDGEMTLDSFSVKNAEAIHQPFAVICYLSQPLEEGLDAKYLYVEPMLKKHYEKNPFINPVRYLPVDFILPVLEKYILNLKIPKEYELAELPKNIQLSTESKKVTYTYLYKNPSPNQIQVSSELKIDNPIILPSEYLNLRELFNQMMGLQASHLVLKKK